ncbi:hypothetical protein [Microvirga sesbaniae]|uniref:hypothetical protein n=1 Tax=Microvirga sesbaniae TaxID=681392 RepID=UPI0021C9BA99|nr:hypothetical protein [Microvirga sp. HBU67692]
MAGLTGRWLVAASLVGLLAGPSTALAQAARPWVDPPSETETKALQPNPAPSSLPASPPAQAAAPSGATPPGPSPAEAKAGTEAQPAAETSSRSAVADTQAKPRTTAERKTRSRSQQANASARSQRRDAQVARRRAAGTQISQAEPRSAIERRARVTRYGSVREGLDAGLQVMRLRTIQLPDGRRIDILTRPDQDIASGLPDGY